MEIFIQMMHHHPRNPGFKFGKGYSHGRRVANIHLTIRTAAVWTAVTIVQLTIHTVAVWVTLI